jgi:transketolase
MRKASLNGVYELAKEDSRVIFIGSDLGPGVLDEMKRGMPGRFIMEGVAEQHIVGLAAGLALDGFIPYINTIATFLTRRCFDQIAIDLCLQNLPVRLIGSGGGLVYAPLGSTHLAIEDISLMTSLPNMTVLAPCDAVEMAALMKETIIWDGPIYIRLGKGGDRVITTEHESIKIGRSLLKRIPRDGLFVTTGVMTQVALDACDELNKDGLDCGVLHMHTIKPFDTELLKKWIPKVSAVVAVEEHSKHGGLSSALLDFMADEMPKEINKLERVGINDIFPSGYGSQESMMLQFGLDCISLAKLMKSKLEHVNEK